MLKAGVFANLCTLCISMLELHPLACRKHKRQKSVEADTRGIGPNREQDVRAASGVSRSSSFSSTKQLVAGTCRVSVTCSATHLFLQQLLVQLRLNPSAATSVCLIALLCDNMWLATTHCQYNC